MNIHEDPRLRLLAAGSDPAHGVAVLEALDATRIVVRVGADATAPGAAVAVAAAAAIFARIFGEVAVEPGLGLPVNWWAATTTTDLLERLRPLVPANPGSRRDVVVTVGAQGVAPGDLGVGGDDWIAALDHHPVPVSAGTHALGVHAAVCLAAGQLLGRALGPLGFPTVALAGPYRLDLRSHRPLPDTVLDQACAKGDLASHRGGGTGEPAEVALAGVGSVGTSTAALLATALAPGLPATALPASIPRPRLHLIDADTLDPGRNPYRYPALVGGESGAKATVFADKLAALGLPAEPTRARVGAWTVTREHPGFDGLVVSSVDTLAGRLEVADILARETLSLGVAGLALHAQREPINADRACPYCDYIDAAPPSTQAEVHARHTGLGVARVLELLGGDDSRLSEADVEATIAAGRLSPQRREALVGAPLGDLIGQVYAEAAPATPTGDGRPPSAVAVAAPHVSWFAGVIAASEIIKSLTGQTALDGRVDVDLAGLPPGLIRVMPPDPSGRCVCHSGVRRRWARRLYLELSQ